MYLLVCESRITIIIIERLIEVLEQDNRQRWQIKELEISTYLPIWEVSDSYFKYENTTNSYEKPMSLDFIHNETEMNNGKDS